MPRKYAKDFLEACRKAGRDPSTVSDPEAYMRAYIRTGKQLKESRNK